VRTFGPLTEDLLQRVDWLVAAGGTAVARERSGSYWKPLYNLLEGVLEQVLVSANTARSVTSTRRWWLASRIDT
jgi:transposase